jgi:hypothetical protein
LMAGSSRKGRFCSRMAYPMAGVTAFSRRLIDDSIEAPATWPGRNGPLVGPEEQFGTGRPLDPATRVAEQSAVDGERRASNLLVPALHHPHPAATRSGSNDSNGSNDVGRASHDPTSAAI